jgi:hypothetical protein
MGGPHGASGASESAAGDIMATKPMSAYTKKEIRSKSMVGTVLFALGVIALVAAVITRSVWIAGAGAGVLAVAGVMLYQVGRSLR